MRKSVRGSNEPEHLSDFLSTQRKSVFLRGSEGKGITPSSHILKTPHASVGNLGVPLPEVDLSRETSVMFSQDGRQGGSAGADGRGKDKNKGFGGGGFTSDSESESPKYRKSVKDLKGSRKSEIGRKSTHRPVARDRSRSGGRDDDADGSLRNRKSKHGGGSAGKNADGKNADSKNAASGKGNKGNKSDEETGNRKASGEDSDAGKKAGDASLRDGDDADGNRKDKSKGAGGITSGSESEHGKSGKDLNGSNKPDAATHGPGTGGRSPSTDRDNVEGGAGNDKSKRNGSAAENADGKNAASGKGLKSGKSDDESGKGNATNADSGQRGSSDAGKQKTDSELGKQITSDADSGKRKTSGEGSEGRNKSDDTSSPRKGSDNQSDKSGQDADGTEKRKGSDDKSEAMRSGIPVQLVKTEDLPKDTDDKDGDKNKKTKKDGKSKKKGEKDKKKKGKNKGRSDSEIEEDTNGASSNLDTGNQSRRMLPSSERSAEDDETFQWLLDQESSKNGKFTSYAAEDLLREMPEHQWLLVPSIKWNLLREEKENQRLQAQAEAEEAARIAALEDVEMEGEGYEEAEVVSLFQRAPSDPPCIPKPCFCKNEIRESVPVCKEPYEVVQLTPSQKCWQEYFAKQEKDKRCREAEKHASVCEEQEEMEGEEHEEEECLSEVQPPSSDPRCEAICQDEGRSSPDQVCKEPALTPSEQCWEDYLKAAEMEEGVQVKIASKFQPPSNDPCCLPCHCSSNDENRKSSVPRCKEPTQVEMTPSEKCWEDYLKPLEMEGEGHECGTVPQLQRLPSDPCCVPSVCHKSEECKLSGPVCKEPAEVEVTESGKIWDEYLHADAAEAEGEGHEDVELVSLFQRPPSDPCCDPNPCTCSDERPVCKEPAKVERTPSEKCWEDFLTKQRKESRMRWFACVLLAAHTKRPTPNWIPPSEEDIRQQAENEAILAPALNEPNDIVVDAVEPGPVQQPKDVKGSNGNGGGGGKPKLLQKTGKGNRPK